MINLVGIKAAKENTLLKTGTYYAQISKIELKKTEPQEGSPLKYYELTFNIMTGQFEGSVITDRLFLEGKDQQSTDSALGRLVLLLECLNIPIPQAAVNYDVFPPQIIHKMICFKYQQRYYDDKDGNRKKTGNIKFAGFVPVNEYRPEFDEQLTELPEPEQNTKTEAKQTSAWK